MVFKHYRRSTSGANCRPVCACCCTILLAPLITIIVFLNIHHTAPLFQVGRLYIPALDKSSNASTNASIIFDLYFQNLERFSNVYYDPINVTFYDSPNRNHSVANFTIPELTVKHKPRVNDRRVKSGAVNATGLDLEGAKREIAANGFKIFNVSLETSVRYDYYALWKSKRHAYRADVGVKIGDTGAAI
ncbi:hypothetical protein LUZ61_004702 [Rhynchospora tenuis]|uniref:Late embryogenesis abundant protein LEA-2 subgroup domain-containing protein n=1 Tax=Rhynchospora tenuis TaxID=198213 RepID=A0AAD5ZN70_9POAL|nr:hypothetical protein LUZ61_004702 [Rhynchospora tenuis]